MPRAVCLGAMAIVVASTAEEGHGQAGTRVGVPVPHIVVLIGTAGASIQMSRVPMATTINSY